jgi:nitrilase
LNSDGPLKVAAVQATPVFLDRDATVEKACRLIGEAAAQGAKLIVFPEAFVPGYPDWVWAVPPGEGALLDRLYAELLANSVVVPGEAVDRLGEAAREAGAWVVVGVNERNVEASGGSIYNTLLFFDDAGRLAGRHRKLVPTSAERLVWAQGDGSTLEVFDTPVGKLGALICWENYMPLARYALYAWGTEVYLAPTWDRGQTWLATLRHIAKEGRCYVVGCCIALRRAEVPERLGLGQWYREDDDWINVGDSAIVAPGGDFIAGPVRLKEEVLYATLDMEVLRGQKRLFDVAGHYGRPDVFRLSVMREPRPMLREEGE